ncbi:MAG TPA: hypothetical protein DEP72_02685 [Clostridiales bacterium]|nr:MAG: hypothetical protein A2Y18_06520 [Clostridiales bacterium GWD2_32_19]HCC07061.1 hypothetical protein [Clostridiales bacterium]
MTENLFSLKQHQLGIWDTKVSYQSTPVNNIEGKVRYEMDIVEIDYLKQLFNLEKIDSIFRHMFNLLACAILYSKKDYIN